MTLRDQIKEYGSIRKAAHALGIPRSTLQYRLKREPEQGQETDGVIPEGYRAKGTSTLYAADGSVKLQWVKTQIDPECMASIMDTMREEFAATITSCIPVLYEPNDTESDLLTTYILTDYHAGMFAWHEETGADWDIKIAEEGLIRYFTRAASLSPNSETAILANIGDMLHYDGMLPVTPTSKHVLDADTRFQKLIRVVIRSLRHAVSILLDKHKYVHIIMSQGNHDEASSAWLRECFAEFYADEHRVTVDTRPDPYYCYEHGLTSLFFHHGHRKRIGSIDSVFAGKFREVFGRTKYSYGHMGHLHSSEVKETNLMILEQHRTLAAPDAYASSGGWLSGRSACAITYSKEYGELSRVTIPWEMLKS